jgi:hypothetical protein
MRIPIIIAAIIIATPALASTTLCVETGRTGFSWKNGEWVSVDFTVEQWIARRTTAGDPQDFGCHDRLAARGITDEIVQGQYGDSATACYVIYQVGTEPADFDIYDCRESYSDEKGMWIASCESAFQDFQFGPSNEFVMSRTYAVPVYAPENATSKDSLVVAVGKCSVIAP